MADDRMEEALEWCRRAAVLEPGDPRNAYTLAFYLDASGDRAAALRVLRDLIELHPTDGDARDLLATFTEESDDRQRDHDD